ncbi:MULTISPECIES: ribbon-helix-helix domain-containing protein [unclassified Stappia]|uniref:ribbon-helix-helix domain-containing protein n=1 Tax=unclassified Stappia TaxID=2629676 RepID=UPI0016438752|nr:MULTISPECIES: ribbon-helix-helix domain-containing protein [unclassified Stappia]
MLAKRSLTLHGHRTSLALEPEFWEVLEEMAEAGNISLPALVARIDDAREIETVGGGDLPSSLSSALRVAALAHCRAKA